MTMKKIFLKFVSFLVFISVEVSANQSSCPNLASDIGLLQTRKNQLTSPAGRDNYESILANYNQLAAKYSLLRGIDQIRDRYRDILGFATGGMASGSTMILATDLFSGDLSSTAIYLSMEGTLRRLLSGAGGLTLDSLLPNCTDSNSCQRAIVPVCPDLSQNCPREQKAAPLFHALVGSCAQAGQNSDPFCQYLASLDGADANLTRQRLSLMGMLENFSQTFITAQALEQTTSLSLEQRREIKSDLFALNINLHDGVLSASIENEYDASEIARRIFGHHVAFDSLNATYSTALSAYESCLERESEYRYRANCGAFNESGRCIRFRHADHLLDQTALTESAAQIERCYQCWSQDSRFCQADFRPTGATGEADGGVRQIISSSFSQFTQAIRPDVEASPLLRQELIGRRIDQIVGSNNVDDILAHYEQRYLLDENNPLTSTSIISSMDQDRLTSLERHRSLIELSSRLKLNPNVPPSPFYTLNTEGSRFIINDLGRRIMLTRNQQEISRAMSSQTDKTLDREKLLGIELTSDQYLLEHTILSDLFRLKDDPLFSEIGGCFSNLPDIAEIPESGLTQEILDAQRSNHDFLNRILHHCIVESDLALRQLQLDGRGSEQSIYQAEAALIAAARQLRDIEASNDFISLERTQQDLYQVYTFFCSGQGEENLHRNTCNLNGVLPIEISGFRRRDSNLNFLLDNTGQVLAEIGEFNIGESATPRGSLSTISRLCEMPTSRTSQGTAMAEIIRASCAGIANLGQFNFVDSPSSLVSLTAVPPSIVSTDESSSDPQEQGTAQRRPIDRDLARSRNLNRDRDHNGNYRSPASTPSRSSVYQPSNATRTSTTASSFNSASSTSYNFLNPGFGTGLNYGFPTTFGFNPLLAPFSQGFVGMPYYRQTFILPSSLISF
jgi:hypothetical protein